MCCTDLMQGIQVSAWLQVKAESLKQLTVEQNVDILLLAETKVYSKSGVKNWGFSGISCSQEKELQWRIDHCHQTWTLLINDY